MTALDTAFAIGLGIGAAGCGGVATLGIAAYALDLIALRRKKRATRRASKPASPIEDLTRWKRQRRLDDAATWQEAFDAINSIGRSKGGFIRPVPRGYLDRDLRMLTDNYGSRRGRELWLRGWDGLHHSTCPYECDCPQDVRSHTFRRASA